MARESLIQGFGDGLTYARLTDENDRLKRMRKTAQMTPLRTI
jgi:hypothetical protein